MKSFIKDEFSARLGRVTDDQLRATVPIGNVFFGVCLLLSFLTFAPLSMLFGTIGLSGGVRSYYAPAFVEKVSGG